MTGPGPSQAMDMVGLGVLAGEPHRLMSHGRLRRACNDGKLHGHQRFEHAPWNVSLDVALAWRGGASYAEQKRLCPMCAHLGSIPRQQRGGLYAVPGGAH